jgi:uncharacterized protein
MEDGMKKLFYPLPTRILTNGEFDPPPQNERQRMVEKTLDRLADRYAGPLRMTRRQFFRTASGLAAGFLAMNMVYGPHFLVDEAEAADPAAAAETAARTAGQLVFDDQLHYVHEDFRFQGLLDLRKYAADNWNPALHEKPLTFDSLQFENFLEEVYLQSVTHVGLLSGAPADNPQNWFLENDAIVQTREKINAIAGSRRMLAHFVITPGQEGWLEEMDRAIAELRPDSWKGYTVGDPLAPSRYPYRLDDEELMYPAYERMVRSGIRTFCVHKGLVPNDYRTEFPTWEYAKVDDLPKAARDWPEIRFVIYHAALQPLNEYTDDHLRTFESTGRIDWVTDLAEIPSAHGVRNIAADLGTSFANCAVDHPRHAAGLLGTLIKGLGVENVYWGTDSVWYGSPQWQIEAFRRLEIPEDLRERFGFDPLGGPDSPVKQAILGGNAAQLYGVDPERAVGEYAQDRLGRARLEYEGADERSRRNVVAALCAPVHA